MYYVVKVNGNKVEVGDATFGESNVELTKSELLETLKESGMKCLGVTITSDGHSNFMGIKDVFIMFCRVRQIVFRPCKGGIEVLGKTDKFPSQKQVKDSNNTVWTRIDVYDTRNINALAEMLNFN